MSHIEVSENNLSDDVKRKELYKQENQKNIKLLFQKLLENQVWNTWNWKKERTGYKKELKEVERTLNGKLKKWFFR